MNRVDIALSKKVSYLLRHVIINKGLDMNDEGYVKVQDILSLNEFKNNTFAHINKVVANDSKQRFKLKKIDKMWFIRANQGHSKDIGNLIDDTKALKPFDIQRQHYAYHGTTQYAWNLIQLTGIKSMRRKHVHLAKDINTKSGIRHNSEIIIQVNLLKAKNMGIHFVESSNGIILTSNDIPFECIERKY